MDKDSVEFLKNLNRGMQQMEDQDRENEQEEGTFTEDDNYIVSMRAWSIQEALEVCKHVSEYNGIVGDMTTRQFLDLANDLFGYVMQDVLDDELDDSGDVGASKGLTDGI